VSVFGFLTVRFAGSRLPLPAADADLMRTHLDALKLKDSIPPK